MQNLNDSTTVGTLLLFSLFGIFFYPVSLQVIKEAEELAELRYENTVNGIKAEKMR